MDPLSNFTIPATVNMTYLASSYHGSLAGRTDAEIIGGYCLLFKTVSWYWTSIILFLLLTNPLVQKLLKNNHPILAWYYDYATFALNAGFVMVVLVIAVIS
jgi:hypothetical protein